MSIAKLVAVQPLGANVPTMTDVPPSRPSSELPEQEPIDPFFHLGRGGSFNACIGRQGTEENYIDGYMEAAQELVSAVIDKRQYGKRDTLAMPILYNTRHAIELTLKFAINALHKLGRVPTVARADHDIESHWNTLGQGSVGDEALRGIIVELGPFVKSLASIDEDGQELRYATNRDESKSLASLSLVDLEYVQESLSTLAELLSRLKYRVIDLREEKDSGTWTTSCSRSDLMNVARLLPDRAEWTGSAFEAAKTAAMKRFEIGSRKFSDAVNKIEASREACLHIGIESDLLHVTDAHVLRAIELWQEVHPPSRTPKENDLGIVSAKSLRNGMVERHGLRRGVVARFVQEFKLEEIADLETIFYLGRDRWMSEHYEKMLEGTKKEYALARNIEEKITHIIDKTNFASEIQNGLRLLGRPSLANKVEAIVVTQEGAKSSQP